MVEPDGDVAGELEVLALVVADGHPVGVVEEHVGGHEHRVVEQPDAHRLPSAGFLLELRHPLEFAERGHAVEDPGELGVLRHVALDEQGAALRVEAGGQEEHRRTARRRREVRRIVRKGHRVEVDHAVKGRVGRRAVALGVDPLAHGAEVVAEVDLSGRLDSREHAWHGR